MNNVRVILFIFVLIFAHSLSYSQLKDWGSKIGLRADIIFPENDFSNLGFSGNNDFSFDWYKFSYLGEAFFGLAATRSLEVHLNLGYGIYSGKAYFDNPDENYGEYQATIIPVYLTFRITPWDMQSWNPYFYIGGGMMSYDLTRIPVDIPGENNASAAGWSGLIPVGIGAEFLLSDNFFFDLSAGGGFSTGFDIEGYRNENDETWESYFNIGLGLTMITESCESDRDNDLLGRCDEEKFGSDPKNPDTDNDGLNDGEEVLTFYTNPIKADSDEDNLSDYDEIKIHTTNPLNADTDGDGLTDGNEILKHKTNPLKPDSDNDDLTDSLEVFKYSTNPLRSDTDGDGISDGAEVITYFTDPVNIDSDFDGLSDGEEIVNYETDPNNRDTDGGSVDDFTEIKRETNPLDASDDRIKINVPIVLEGITFATGKADIEPESEKVLQGALITMLSNPDIIVEISGHTDDVGSESNNKNLSQKRAESVRFWLIKNGVEPDRILAKGYGEDFPRVPNDSAENRRINRRIEFKRIR